VDIATIIGIALGIGLLLGSIMLGGDVALFIDSPSLMMTMGGALAGVLISYPISQVIDAFRTFRIVFAPKRRGKNTELVEFLVYLVEKSRREGLLALEDELETLTDPFFRRGLELVIDGTPPELVRDILEKDIDSLIVRHRQGRGVFETLGALCPAFGMIGTLVGLIRMLKDLDDPSNIGSGMALALMTTLYGAVAAYLVFIPVAGKLKVRSTEEIRSKEMVIEGLLAVLAGESPRYTREKLTSFLSPHEREELAWAVRPSIGEGEGVEAYAE
jgi:chemotaxis protein MotA